MAFFRQFPRTAYVVDGNLINIPDILITISLNTDTFI